MPFHSSYISQSIGGQMSMFSGQMGYAQQLSYPMMQGGQPGAPPPSPVGAPGMAPPPSLAQSFMGAGPGAHTPGQFGEQAAATGASFMQNVAAPTAVAGAQIAGGMGMLGAAGKMLDPFSMVFGAGRAGFAAAGGGMGGLAAGGLAAGAAALPFYGAYKAADAYGGAFTSGMQNQAALNQTLRRNFQHFGGSGPQGRGFSQEQMGMVGGIVQNELNSNPFTSAQELNTLIGGGAQAGMFQGVRDVSEFSQKFKKMLDTLKQVQKDLGGSLQEALQFVQQSKQSGIFQQSDRLRFSAGVRETSAMTGMSSQEIMSLTSQGAQLSRAIGGKGSQGAFGALQGAQTLGTAVQEGIVSEQQIAEMTGMTGTRGLQAAVGQMMGDVARFSRRGAGRYSIYGLAGESGERLDEGQLQRFLSGEIGPGELSRRAHKNVGRMGRAEAINNEGRLRGALLEQGGLSGQIGMMRMMVGDRVEGLDEDLGSLVLQRRFNMERPQAELMMNLMRNQGRIREAEAMTSAQSGREAAMQADIRENRSLDAFQRRLGRGLKEGMGLQRAEEMGRDFMTEVSSTIEDVMNDMLGVAKSSMRRESRRSLQRISMGKGTAADREYARFMQQQAQQVSGGISGEDLFDQNLNQQLFNRGGIGQQIAQGALGPLGAARAMISGDPRDAVVNFGQDRLTLGQQLQARGMQNVRGMGAAEVNAAVTRAQRAQTGQVGGADADALQALMADRSGTMRRINRARLAAQGGEAGSFYALAGDNANAVDAFMARQGIEGPGALDINRGAMANLLGNQGGATAGMLFRDISRAASMGAGAFVEFGGDDGVSLGLGGFETTQAQRTGRDRLIDRIAGSTNLSEDYMHRAETAMNAAERASDEQSKKRLQRKAAGYRGIARAFEKVKPKTVQTVLENESVRDTMRTISRAAASGDKEAVQSGLQTLETLQGTLGGDQQAALAKVTGQLRNADNLEAVSAMSGQMGTDKEALTAFMQDNIMRGNEFAAMGQELGNTELGKKFKAAGELYTQHKTLKAGEQIRAAREQMLGMDAESEEYMEVVDALSETDAGQAQLASLSRRRAQRDARMGQGRRGRRQQAETLLSDITGGGFGALDIKLRGRKVGASQIFRTLRGRTDDEDFQSIKSQLKRQMAEQFGTDTEVTEDLLGKLNAMVGRDSAGGVKITEEEEKEFQRSLYRSDEELSKAREKREEELLEKARRENPLDTERNAHLEKIARATEQSAQTMQSLIESGAISPTEDGRESD